MEAVSQGNIVSTHFVFFALERDETKRQLIQLFVICFVSLRNGKSEDLEAFVARHDRFMNTTRSTLLDNRQDHAQEIPTTTPSISGRALLSHAHLTIINDFPNIDDLARHVEQINLLDQERLRPGWDAYFMASH